MRDEDPTSRTRGGREQPTRSNRRSKRDTASRMGARRWAIASLYHDPEEYGIPTVPEWTVRRTDTGVAFAESEGTEPFISAESPVRVRR
ncbi:hypothetical protein C2R22_02510 [Salinigranum rubrum]|uniref:Uncharacterized protein n=1 Tax=Salinigranum rubrum TaxID=755307 RepID=A0A2I8VFF4_9EURY|nr:hypothetical protein [Salinigranum rubrum]AUV80663.1 hypothetical protein C2R22_02510 [Salinigranum rubrum]